MEGFDRWGVGVTAAILPWVNGSELRAGKSVIVKWFRKLEEHFNKHWAEFGAKNKHEYAKQASDFMSPTTQKNIIQWERSRDWATLKLNTKTEIFEYWVRMVS